MSKTKVAIGVVAVMAFSALLLTLGALYFPYAEPSVRSLPSADAGSGGTAPAGRGIAQLNPLHVAHTNAARPVACDDCHESAVEVHRCATCHVERRETAHAKLADAEARECLVCHDFLHAPSAMRGVWGCAECHSKTRGPAPTRGKVPPPLPVHSEQKCSHCHAPHAEPAVIRTACADAKCHGEQLTDHGGSKLEDKARCLGCHEPHGAADSARGKCRGCHAESPPPSPVADGHPECESCHAPHGFTRDTVRGCVECHGDKEETMAALGGGHATCTGCHASHTAEGATTRKGGLSTACTGCHDVSRSDASGHRGIDCRRCHRPHQRLVPASGDSGCTSCHKAQAKSARSGHAACGRCHGGPHAPQPRGDACGGCHREQHKSAPRGHRKCTACHQGHTGSLKGTASCEGCHAQMAKGQHRDVRDGCRRCHRPHGPKGRAKPITCGGCHGRSKLPGLHRNAGHAKCERCHGPHDASPPTRRATCTRGCHADAVDHRTDGRTCATQGCHKFR